MCGFLIQIQTIHTGELWWLILLFSPVYLWRSISHLKSGMGIWGLHQRGNIRFTE
jgi:hypothetical protein